MLCFAFAIACTDTTASAPYESSSIPKGAPLVVDTGPLPYGEVAVAYEPKDSPSHVYAFSAGGTGPRQVTPGDQWASAPAWSPDGARIAYERSVDASVTEIWIIRSDGSGAARIAADGSSPFWLDDARVGFGCATGICVAGADGSGPATLIAHEAPSGSLDDSFTLSPDGTSVAFVRHDAVDGTGRIYVMNRDGTGQRALTSMGAPAVESESFPSWSPDGKRIAFYSGRYGIAVADADGRSIVGISRLGDIVPDIGGGGPAWCSSEKVVFGGDARRFYIGNADGSGVIRRVDVEYMPASSNQFTIARWSWKSGEPI